MISKNKKLVVVFGMLVFVGLAFLLFANYRILRYDTNIVNSIESVPTSTMVLVFGGGMKNATEMSDMQTDRVAVAIAGYQKGKFKKIMFTGDDGAFHDDEISAMKKYALEHGVRSDDILTDPHGYRTYESCYREAQIYGVTSTVAISQSFHLPRIRYLCEHFGIKVIGLSADVRDYHSLWVTYIRESLARTKAWFDINLFKPFPRNLGK